MVNDERQKESTSHWFRMVKWLVLLNTLYWIAYIAGAQMGKEDVFPLGREIMRLENRERVFFLDPAVSQAVSATTQVHDPRKKKGHIIVPESQTWAFSVNLDGPYGLGVRPGFAMKINPRVELLDAEGTLLADNRTSPYSWTPYPRTSKRYAGDEDQDRRRANTHGPGLTATLTGGVTYLLRVSPGTNQDYVHRVYRGRDMETEPNSYQLIIQPYRSERNGGVIAVSMLFGVPILYIVLLIRFAMRQNKNGGTVRAQQRADTRFSEFKQRVDATRNKKDEE